MNLLVTGCAGFIGCNFVKYMLARYDKLNIVNVDSLTYAGNLENLKDIEADKRHQFIKADISNAAAMRKIFKRHSFDAVVNFAAESHVDRSLHVGASAFIQTNILGVQVLLDATREFGVKRFLQISTDEVYGSLGPRGMFSEKTPVAPNNPYAATKAGADFLVRAAHHSHKLDAVITRCSNNYGPYQFPEKLIPLMIANALDNKPLPVYGDGLQRRDWIFVLDHCSAVDRVLRKAAPGSIYNIGMGHDVPNIQIVKSILGILGKPESLIKHVADRPGHDRRYSMDAALLTKDLGWKPKYTFEKGLQLTVDWYLNNKEWWQRIRSGEYRNYYKKLYSRRLAD